MGEGNSKKSVSRNVKDEVSLRSLFLLPLMGVAAVQGMTLVLLASAPSSLNVDAYEPFGSGFTASIFNSLFLLTGVVAMTTILIIFLRRKKISFLRNMLIGVLSLSAFIFTTFLAEGLLYQFLMEYALLVALLMGITVASLAAYGAYNTRFKLTSSITSLIISSEIAVMLSLTLTFPTILILPLIFSIYDIYAVTRGPLRTLLSFPETRVLAPLSLKIGSIEMGIGDLVFYSLLPSAGMILSGSSAFLSVLVGTDVGVILTLAALRKGKALPGLPLPMILGLVMLIPFVF
ncbi:MAG: hypothetical protein ACE5KG_03720 [Nitrososphaerales archaeon]